ncbi:hypothetical protein A2U01_0111091, partial [Trifolium medium]|nr:hypothetical protein [Trifolium medium]
AAARKSDGKSQGSEGSLLQRQKATGIRYFLASSRESDGHFPSSLACSLGELALFLRVPRAV